MEQHITTSYKNKYNLGCAMEKETVFDFQFILDKETVSYIGQFGKVMFIIRGPPFIGKRTLNIMLANEYPEAIFCRADDYFRKKSPSPARTKEAVEASHKYCQKECSKACKKGVNIIVIHNTNIKKWQMQPYLDFAATYNYTVVMAILLYKFHVTPEALLANDTYGLELPYYKYCLEKWEDVPPVLTGWFLCPSDTWIVLHSALETIKVLTNDRKFCRIFDIFDQDKVTELFEARRLLFGLAGYSEDTLDMKNYYFSDTVQDAYGKCFIITILGFLVNATGISAIVDINSSMKDLFLDRKQEARSQNFCDSLSDLSAKNNMWQHNKTLPFEDIVVPLTSTVNFTNWIEGEVIDAKNCTLIQLAQKFEESYNIGKSRENFHKSLQLAADENGVISENCFTELENKVKISSLKNDEWIVKAPQKIYVNSVYTGLYI